MLLQAVALLEQAVERDPTFVEGYCQLASAHDFLYGYFDFDHTPARLALADAAVKTAQRLAPDAGEVHMALARHLLIRATGISSVRERNWRLRRKHCRTRPILSAWPPALTDVRGAGKSAFASLQRVVELDPRNPVALQQLAGGYQQMRHYPEADAALDRALAFAPKDASSPRNEGGACDSSGALILILCIPPSTRFSQKIQAQLPCMPIAGYMWHFVNGISSVRGVR